jgi:glycine/D-amino acid oxidase-like deaminating enzyme
MGAGRGAVATDDAPAGADVVIVGSGVVGASCAYELARLGRAVVVVDRGHLTSGTTASGEGNVLVSDKPPGPELDLALASVARWHDYARELAQPFEFEAKGGIAVSTRSDGGSALARLAAGQRASGVEVEVLDGAGLRALEPELAHDLEVGAHYPQDAQVQPVLASSALLTEARRLGARVVAGAEVTAIERDGEGRVASVVTSRGRIATRALVVAAGPWSPEVARLAGSDLPVRPRKGHLLVTEPLPRLVHHKVYEADYVDTLVADTAEAQTSAVVEGTASGTILLGSSRELVGFDPAIDLDIVRRIAAKAVRLFPVLARASLLRVYVGFRPWVPDHLPIIGPDPRVGGLWHATGHEGAGIGLAPGTGLAIAALVTGATSAIDVTAFAADRPALLAGATHG